MFQSITLLFCSCLWSVYQTIQSLMLYILSGELFSFCTMNVILEELITIPDVCTDLNAEASVFMECILDFNAS